MGLKEINKTHSDNYVKTEAIVTYIDYGDSQGLRYLYFDEDGNEIISNDGASWGGISFKAGQKVTIYYNKQNPQMLVNIGTAVLELCGALFFVLGGLIAFLANMELHKFIPIIFCLTFMCFSGGILAGTMLSSGMNLWQVYTGGVLGFACCLFFLIGFALLIPSVIDFVKIIKNTIKNKRENKEYYRELKEVKSKYINAEDYDGKPKIKKERKPRVKYKHKFFCAVLIYIFVGLAFGGVGVYAFSLGVKELVIASHYAKCEATVTDLRLFEKEGDLLGCAIYTYTVDGVEYTQESTYSQSAELLPEIGKVVTIRYNKNDPTDIKDGNWINLIELFVSFIPMGVGVGMFIYSWILMRVPPDQAELEYTKKEL